MAGAGTRLLLLCTVAALLALGRADEGWDDTDEYDDVEENDFGAPGDGLALSPQAAGTALQDPNLAVLICLSGRAQRISAATKVRTPLATARCPASGAPLCSPPACSHVSARAGRPDRQPQAGGHQARRRRPDGRAPPAATPPRPQMQPRRCSITAALRAYRLRRSSASRRR
jgi:hypothetical protein